MRRLVLGAVVVAVALALPVPAAGAVPADGLVTTEVDGVTVTTTEPIETAEALAAFLLSATPKDVEVDVDTGGVVSVTERVVPTVTPFVTVSGACGAGDACLVSGSAPLTDYGFRGPAGTVTGSWPSRVRWRTGSRTAQAWYRHPQTSVTTSWGGVLGPNTEVTASVLVTAVRVTLY
ncbi:MULTISPECIES: hypothetical protein [Cellulomonas]|jgi:hypothetical protein|uniref:hypothetical protein n=1 Tax=Cellulomonas TaxID=1707 RepID=UPI000AA45B01|nr:MULTISPECIES: hypothetical protein [Cellulomonas]